MHVQIINIDRIYIHVLTYTIYNYIIQTYTNIPTYISTHNNSRFVVTEDISEYRSGGNLSSPESRLF